MCFVEDSGALNDGLIKFAKSLFLRSNIDNDGWKDFPQVRFTDWLADWLNLRRKGWVRSYSHFPQVILIG